MDAFRVHTGIAAPLLRNNVDTDAIIPSAEMKRVSKLGLGEGLFAAWRYRAPGSREPDPQFVLNQTAYRDASILLAGSNFGCGSSREHAVWALREYGIRAIIAPSFGSIFYANCVRNGILPVQLEEDAVHDLAEQLSVAPAERALKIDLEHRTIAAPGCATIHFDIEDSDREMLLEGLDMISQTLKRAVAIDAFETADRLARPWIYLDA